MSLWVRTAGGDLWVCLKRALGFIVLCIRNAIVGCALVHSILASVPERENLTGITLKVQQLWTCLQHSQLQLTPLN